MALFSSDEEIMKHADTILDFFRLYVADRAQFLGIGRQSASFSSFSHPNGSDVALFSAAGFQAAIRHFGGSGGQPTPFFINFVLANAERAGILLKFRTHSPVESYLVFDPALEEALARNELGAYLFGWNYTIRKKRNAILEIVVEEGGEQSTGTGVVVRAGDGKLVGITCGHVLFDRSGKSRVVKSVCSPKRDIEVSEAAYFSRIDIAMFNLDSEVCASDEAFGIDHADVLDEVVTIGFPRVLIGRENPLLFNRGQNCGWFGSVEAGDHYGVVSARVAPGNSGGPVINDSGNCVGIVSDRYEYEWKDSRFDLPLFVSAAQIIHDWTSSLFVERDMKRA